MLIHDLGAHVTIFFVVFRPYQKEWENEALSTVVLTDRQEGQPVEKQPVDKHDPLHCVLCSKLTD